MEKLQGHRDEDDKDRDKDDSPSYVPLRPTGEKAEIRGVELEPGKAFPAAVDMAKQPLGTGDIVIEQHSAGKSDAGVVLRFRK